MASNEFTKQLSSPNVVDAPRLQTNTGSTASDVVSALGFGLQVYNQLEGNKQKQQQLLAQDKSEKESMVGVNFANTLLAEVSQKSSMQARRLIRTKREAEFLENNRNNPLAVESYFKTMKGRNQETALEEAQKARIKAEEREAKYKEELTQEGLSYVTGMQGTPEYQELIEKYGDAIPKELYEQVAITRRGKNQILADKQARISYATAERVEGETVARNEIMAIAETKLSELTLDLKVGSTLTSYTATPEDKLKASAELNRTIQVKREEMDKWLSSLTPEQKRLLDTQSIRDDFEKKVENLAPFTNPDQVVKLSDQKVKQLNQAFLADQLVEGTASGRSVAFLAINSLPQDPTSLFQFQSELRNGKVPIVGLGNKIADIYDGKYSEIPKVIPAFESIAKGVKGDAVGGAKVVSGLLDASNNSRHNLHEPKSDKVIQDLLDTATSSPEGVQELTEEMASRGKDLTESYLQSTKNYINGTLAPTLASLRNSGVEGLRLEVDDKGYLKLDKRASSDEKYTKPTERITFGGAMGNKFINPSDIKASKISREVSIQLNKRIDTLQKILPDVSRVELANLMLNGTKLAFNNVETSTAKQE